MRRIPLALVLVGSLVVAGCAGLPGLKLQGADSGQGGGSLEGQGEGDLRDGHGLDDVVPEPPQESPVPQEQPAPGLGWLVRFHGDMPAEEMRSFAEEKGATFVLRLQALPIAYVLASEGSAQAMAADARTIHVEPDGPVEFFDAESRLAIRQTQVVDPLLGLRDSAGNPIDGRGVGIAIVDTGVHGLHSDLAYQPLVPGGVLVANYKVESLAYVPMPSTDTTAGHGTHVAAIAAGQGLGNPAAKGVAPGARLYGFGAGEATTILWAAQAFDWIILNHAAISPPIRVVNNSWGSGTAYDPAAALTVLTNAMVDRGIVVVYAAGNHGGDGSVAKTSAQCQIPRAGVVCVAAYDDLDTGTRAGPVAPYSSRGLASASATWPDISAPGSRIYSARPMVGSTTGMGLLDPHYIALSGTSAAAPHVAGVLALMIQKNPTQSPAALEDLLKCHAHKFSDGASYSSLGVPGCWGATSSYDKGYGLVDAYSAVSAT